MGGAFFWMDREMQIIEKEAPRGAKGDLMRIDFDFQPRFLKANLDLPWLGDEEYTINVEHQLLTAGNMGRCR